MFGSCCGTAVGLNLEDGADPQLLCEKLTIAYRCFEGWVHYLEGLTVQVEGVTAHIEGVTVHIEGVTVHIEGVTVHVEGVTAHVEGPALDCSNPLVHVWKAARPDRVKCGRKG